MMKINILVVIGVTMATVGIMSLQGAADTLSVGGDSPGPDPDLYCAEAVVKNAIIEINVGTCGDSMKIINVDKTAVNGDNYALVVSNIPKKCDSLGEPELCKGIVNVYKGIATVIPLSVYCESPLGFLLG